MAAPLTVIELWNDITNNVLVKALASTELFLFNTAKLFQNTTVVLRWRPLQPSGSPFSATPYVQVPVTGITLDVGIGPRAGDPAILAEQNVWVAQGDYLEATLSLDTAAMRTAFGSADTLATFFEIAMTIGGSTRPVYQEAVTITSVVLGPAGAIALPAPANLFYTSAQVDAILQSFVKFIGNPPGLTIALLAPTSGNQRIIGVRDDGSSQDDLI